MGTDGALTPADSAPAVEVKPLVCPSCDGPVPLADADQVVCPYCSKPVPISEPLRALKRGLAKFEDERRAAEKLYRRVGKAPPKFLQAFAFFGSVWFWSVGLAFWLTAAMFAFALVLPWVGAHLLKLNVYDVLSRSQQTMVFTGGSLGTVVVGLLLAGWNRKRVVSRAPLQVALAAKEPRSAGGPSQCRRCGAALSVPAGALGVRCDYCRADNLVKIPPDWVSRVRRMTKQMSREERAVVADEAAATRSLRWSLFWRLFFSALILGPMLGLMASNGDPLVDDSEVDVYGDPNTVPKWSKAAVPTWRCDEQGPFLSGGPLRHCHGGHCELAQLFAFEAGRQVQLRLSDPSVVLEAELDVRQVTMLSNLWRPVERFALHDGAGTVTAPLSGWYRVRLIGPDPSPGVRFCVSQPGATDQRAR